MIDENLLNSLNTKEKELFKKGLNDLIEQTYVIENEYKKLNESYASLQNFIKQIIEVQPNALWVLDENGEIFLQNSDAKKLEPLLRKILEHKNKKEFSYKDAYYIVKTVTQTEKTIISATDITEEKRQERLISMGQVAAHLSHEIRNPIGSISLLASTLFKKVDTKTKPLVLEMRKSIWRVERIIKATLLFTKGLNVDAHSFSLLALKDDLEESLAYYTYSKDITFDFQLPDTHMIGDFELLCLVFQNFIFNAIDAIEEGENEEGMIRISYQKEADYTIFHIQDNGKEIKNKNILFEPFKTTKTKGNGLGLALSWQIIKAHGGDIALKDNPKSFEIKIGNTLV
ncbi:sensor histidine kinase [Sulfurospirillum sp. 1612]|uniref:sensor histidine kinase n=1 Tax=Sulfurospirillum sp. 1612 TaxID=3094835 RepID=UPI002F92E9C6